MHITMDNFKNEVMESQNSRMKKIIYEENMQKK